ncbi:tetratricopeptide repeat protein [Altererythrobacter lutimaris]|uniref:Tetratricopeptide repeat protein n=1 Tax=Altererythrobacter lutimaris TaxID=2743979 RepID=A0A850HBX9_9SPHN|nr:tetratricopeptide repeat protein [Altererythrobacter lutimaris]NVE95269.1 tetratricopeptide repeat protein [Altererythrobacter lutimaris]
MLPLMLMQVGPNPAQGGLVDYSAEIQDRPPREAPANDPAGLATSADNSWLKNCLDLVETAPSRAHVQAQLRRTESEGRDQVVANYCLGMASTSLELWSDAMSAFIAARDGSDGSEQRLKARFGVMAGNAAIAATDYANALTILARAQRDAEGAGFGPMASIAAIDQARIFVAQGETEPAVAALGNARRLDPNSGDAWLLSATLMRRLERLDEAQSMIERASELAPVDARVALEAGLIAALGGRDDAARESWNSVISLAPISAEADNARDYLAQLGDAVPTP